MSNNTIYIGYSKAREVEHIRRLKGQIKNLVVDFKVWADDAGTVTTVTPTVEQGDASLGTATLSGNVWTCPLTTSNPGWSLIKLLFTDGTETDVAYIEVFTREPSTIGASDDYGMRVELG